MAATGIVVAVRWPSCAQCAALAPATRKRLTPFGRLITISGQPRTNSIVERRASESPPRAISIRSSIASNALCGMSAGASAGRTVPAGTSPA